VCVSVCIRTHTHTLHRCSDVSPGVGMRHLEGPKNPDGLNLDYVKRRDEILDYLLFFCNIFSLSKKKSKR